MLFASYLFGALSDKIGRKKASFIALLLNGGAILISSFMPEYISFTIVRLITGFGKSIFTKPITVQLSVPHDKSSSILLHLE